MSSADIDTQKLKPKKILLLYQEYDRLKEKAGQSEKYLDSLARLQAEFENFKKRNERERVEFIKYANEEIITEILKILDDFERAIEVGKEKKDFDALYKGIEMIYKDLKEFLKQKGLKAIEAKGKPFNPHEHEAIMQEETIAHPENHVLEELQKGYILNGRVIRPAKVKVAKKPVVQKTEDRVQKSEKNLTSGL